MILPDTNLLVFAYNSGAPDHNEARRWWESLLIGAETIGVPWVVITGFVRLMSNPSTVTPPLPGAEAADCVNDWFEYPHITPIDPGVGHLTHFRRLLATTGGRGNLVPDAHIAALSLEYEAEIHTHNARDFARFPGVRWRNPLR